MPSLPAHPNKYSPQDSFRNYLPKQDNFEVKNGLLFIIYILFKISITSILLMLLWYWLNYYICVDIDFYTNNKLYLLYEAYRGLVWYLFIGFICFQSCRCTYIYSIIISTVSHKNIDKYPKLYIFIIIWCISLMIQTSGLLLTSYAYHNFKNDNSFHKNYHNKYVLNILCSVLNCKNEHIYHFYQFVFGFPLNIFLSISLNHLLYMIYHFKYKSQITQTSVAQRLNSSISMRNPRDRAESSMVSSNQLIGTYLPEYAELYEKSCWNITQKYYGYTVLYSLILLLFLSILYLTISIKTTYFDHYYLEVTIILQAEAYVFNFLLKRIARNLDILRMQKPQNIFMSISFRDPLITSNQFNDISKQNKHHKLSFEVMTQ